MIQLITASGGLFFAHSSLSRPFDREMALFSIPPSLWGEPRFLLPLFSDKSQWSLSLFPLLISSLPCQMTVVFCSSQTQTERATHRLIATKMIRLIVVDPARGDISLYLSNEVKRTMPLRKYNALSSFIKILMSDRPTLSST